VFGSSFFCFRMPDFIMYNPMRMNTIAPTIGGTQPCQEKYKPVEESIAITAYQIIQNRVIEDIPKISRPTQKTAVFSPLNMSNQVRICLGKLLSLTTIPRSLISHERVFIIVGATKRWKNWSLLSCGHL
jgi:hypothetical protein